MTSADSGRYLHRNVYQNKTLDPFNSRHVALRTTNPGNCKVLNTPLQAHNCGPPYHSGPKPAAARASPLLHSRRGAGCSIRLAGWQERSSAHLSLERCTQPCWQSGQPIVTASRRNPEASLPTHKGGLRGPRKCARTSEWNHSSTVGYF